MISFYLAVASTIIYFGLGLKNVPGSNLSCALMAFCWAVSEAQRVGFV